MSAHTPGPWVVEHDPRWMFANINRADGAKPSIAKGIDPADARLIAAAPDLLAALEAVVGHGYLEGRSPSAQDFVSKTAIALARAALARAKGE